MRSALKLKSLRAFLFKTCSSFPLNNRWITNFKAWHGRPRQSLSLYSILIFYHSLPYALSFLSVKLLIFLWTSVQFHISDCCTCCSLCLKCPPFSLQNIVHKPWFIPFRMSNFFLCHTYLMLCLHFIVEFIPSQVLVSLLNWEVIAWAWFDSRIEIIVRNQHHTFLAYSGESNETYWRRVNVNVKVYLRKSSSTPNGCCLALQYGLLICIFVNVFLCWLKDRIKPGKRKKFWYLKLF